MKNLTIQRAINWLKKQPERKEFPYANDDCGCLFTQVLGLDPEKKIIGLNGHLRNNEGGIAKENFVPFHDLFWEKVSCDRYGYKGMLTKVSREKAIEVLKEIEKDFNTAKKAIEILKFMN